MKPAPIDPVSLFHPAVAAWFNRSFAAPTAAHHGWSPLRRDFQRAGIDVGWDE